MAVVYVDSSATGANDGTSWANAYTQMIPALASLTPGSDVIWMNRFHTESSSSIFNLTVPGGNAYNMSAVLSVDKPTNTYYPSASATNNIVTTSNMSIIASISCYGITAQANLITVNNGNVNAQTIKDSIFLLPNANGHLGTNGGAYGGSVKFINTSAWLGNGYVTFSSVFNWFGGAITGHQYTAHTLLEYLSTSYGYIAYLDSVDMSSVASGSTTYRLFRQSGPPDSMHFLTKCAIPEWAEKEPYATPGYPTHPGIYGIEQGVTTTASNISGRLASYSMRGFSSATETIYRTDGFTDPETGTNLSIQMQHSNYVSPVQYAPMRGPSLFGSVDSAGGKTISVLCLEDNWADPPADGEFWIEIWYLGTANTTARDLLSTRSSVTTSGTPFASAAVTWTGSGNAFSTSANVSFVSAGLFEVRPFLAKYESGKSIYVCPKLKIQ